MPQGEIIMLPSLNLEPEHLRQEALSIQFFVAQWPQHHSARRDPEAYFPLAISA